MADAPWSRPDADPLGDMRRVIENATPGPTPPLFLTAQQRARIAAMPGGAEVLAEVDERESYRD